MTKWYLLLIRKRIREHSERWEMTLLKLQDLEVIWTLKVTLCWYSKTRIDIQSLVPVKHIYINSVWRNIRICPICHTCDKSKLCDVNNSDYRGLSMTTIYGADPSNISGRYTHIWGLPRQVKLFRSTGCSIFWHLGGYFLGILGFR